MPSARTRAVSLQAALARGRRRRRRTEPRPSGRRQRERWPAGRTGEKCFSSWLLLTYFCATLAVCVVRAGSAAARLTACRIRRYVPHRQRLLFIAVVIAASSGFGFVARSAAAVII